MKSMVAFASSTRTTHARRRLSRFCGRMFPQRTQWRLLYPRKKAEVGRRCLSPRYLSGSDRVSARGRHRGRKISILYRIVRENWHLSQSHHQSFAVDDTQQDTRASLSGIRSDPGSVPGIVRARPRKPTETPTDDTPMTVSGPLIDRFYCRS